MAYAVRAGELNEPWTRVCDAHPRFVFLVGRDGVQGIVAGLVSDEQEPVL